MWKRGGLTNVYYNSKGFQPINYARVQIELTYSALRPIVWVPVLNLNGEVEKIKVSVDYSQLPYSCSLCKACGHSLARCTDNPNKEEPQPKRKKQQRTQPSTQQKSPVISVSANEADEAYVA
ncbi:hypothetical protein AgCh_023106 [Apium graveolens]